jgi:hypothetical protein
MELRLQVKAGTRVRWRCSWWRPGQCMVVMHEFRLVQLGWRKRGLYGLLMFSFVVSLWSYTLQSTFPSDPLFFRYYLPRSTTTSRGWLRHSFDCSLMIAIEKGSIILRFARRVSWLGS